jgi:hypothetical protein
MAFREGRPLRFGGGASPVFEHGNGFAVKGALRESTARQGVGTR